MRRSWKSSKDVTGDECNVEARVVVSAPGTITPTAATHTPYLGRSLGLSVGWEKAVNSVVGGHVLAMKTAHRRVSFKDVEDVEAMAKEEAAKA